MDISELILFNSCSLCNLASLASLSTFLKSLLSSVSTLVTVLADCNNNLFKSSLLSLIRFSIINCWSLFLIPSKSIFSSLFDNSLITSFFNSIKAAVNLESSSCFNLSRYWFFILSKLHSLFTASYISSRSLLWSLYTLKFADKTSSKASFRRFKDSSCIFSISCFMAVLESLNCFSNILFSFSANNSKDVISILKKNFWNKSS